MTDTDVQQPTAVTTTSPTLAFALERIQMNPEITFQEVRDTGKLAGLSIYPVVYGKARGMLGLDPVLPRRGRLQGELPTQEPVAEPPRAQPLETPARAETSAVSRRPMDPTHKPIRRTRRPGSLAQPSATAVEDLMAYVQSVQGGHDRVRAALEAIRRVVEDALA